jgi:hypothetical protein
MKKKTACQNAHRWIDKSIECVPMDDGYWSDKVFMIDDRYCQSKLINLEPMD